ncbi:MAG: hypothetical protein AAF456_04075 [Planctomycetota bacterium]
MSDNPFNAPAPAPNYQMPAPRSSGERPGMVTFIIVIAIILGGGGVLCNLAGVGTMFVQESMLAMNDEMIKPTEDQLAARKEFLELNAQWLIPNVVFMVGAMVIGAMLLISSIGAFKQSAGGRKFFAMTLLIGAIYIVLRGAFQAYIQITSGTELAELQERMTPPQPGTEGMIEMFTMIGMIVGIGWALGLLLYYVLSCMYMNRSNVKAWYGG